MRARDLAAVAFLVLGVYVLLLLPEFALSAVSTLQLSHEPSIHGSVGFGVWATMGFLFLLNLAVGIGLIVFRNALAQAAFPEEPREASAVDGPAPVDLAGALLAVAGIWLMVTAIGDAMPSFVESLMRSTDPMFGIPLKNPLFVWPKRAGLIFQCLAGMALFFGSHSVARAWHWARSAGKSRLGRID